MVKYSRLIQQSITIPGLVGIESIQEQMKWDGVTLSLELTSVFIGLLI
jgi:hypothetical protein